jgi:methylmalonyl-CoA mutase
MKTFPDFTKIDFSATPAPASYEDWRKRVEAETGKTVKDLVHRTLEQIDLQPVYTKADLAGCETLDTMPGLAPFLRGPYGSMYVTKPWTVRQYAGFSTAEDSNAFYRKNSRGCPWLLICRPIAAMIRIIRALSPMSARRAWRWIPSRT